MAGRSEGTIAIPKKVRVPSLDLDRKTYVTEQIDPWPSNGRKVVYVAFVQHIIINSDYLEIDDVHFRPCYFIDGNSDSNYVSIDFSISSTDH